MKKALFLLSAMALCLASCGQAHTSELTEPPTQAVTEAEALQTYTLTYGEENEYSRTVTTNADTSYPQTELLYKLPAGKYKVRPSEELKTSQFKTVKDCLKYNPNSDYPESFDFLETYSMPIKQEIEFELAGDESIVMSENKTALFSLIKANNETVYYLYSGETGEFGRIVTLNASTDLPVAKYLYKIPAGNYTISTTFDKLASAFIVKDEIAIEDNPDYPEVLVYVGEALQLTAGDNDFNGNAKKEIDIELAEDESILIPNNNRGTEFIVKPKE